VSEAQQGTGSIGRRLTLYLAVVAALLSLLSWGMVAGFARQAAEETQDNVLAAAVTAIAETLRSEQGELRLELPYSAFSMLGAISEDRVFYRVTANGALLTGYADLPVATDPNTRAGEVSFATQSYRGEDLRLATLSRRILAGNQPTLVIVTVGQTREGIATIALDLSRQAGLVSIAFFLVAVLLSFFAARTSLRPLNEIAGAVSRRGPSDLRPLRRPAPDELAPLIAALNRFMDRLGHSIHRSEEFILEAAHRVRTPLATVRVQADLALRNASGEAERNRLRQMIRAIDESSRSAGQLLDHATVAFRADDLLRDHLSLKNLAAQTATAMTPTASMKDIDIDLKAEDIIVAGDAVLLDSALRNILDNAIKYSPEDTTISICVEAKGGYGYITVRDEGTGLGDDPAEVLTQRFKRGRNTENIVGSGLGLTIAADVLAAHGGRLELSNNKEGEGTCASLVLPLL
jgi:two-component system sensor histidine kinase TctE